MKPRVAPGHTFPDGNGYLWEKLADDDPLYPYGSRMGYMRQHRVVVARFIGRPLDRSETVHHINGITTDNRLENLQLRQGRHGKGSAHVCGDCGSVNIVSVQIED